MTLEQQTGSEIPQPTTPLSPEKRLELIRQTLGDIRELFFKEGIDKEGRGTILVLLVESMGQKGELSRRSTAELSGILTDYIGEEIPTEAKSIYGVELNPREPIPPEFIERLAKLLESKENLEFGDKFRRLMGLPPRVVRISGPRNVRFVKKGGEK